MLDQLCGKFVKLSMRKAMPMLAIPTDDGDFLFI